MMSVGRMIITLLLHITTAQSQLPAGNILIDPSTGQPVNLSSPLVPAISGFPLFDETDLVLNNLVLHLFKRRIQIDRYFNSKRSTLSPEEIVKFNGTTPSPPISTSSLPVVSTSPTPLSSPVTSAPTSSSMPASSSSVPVSVTTPVPIVSSSSTTSSSSPLPVSTSASPSSLVTASSTTNSPVVTSSSPSTAVPVTNGSQPTVASTPASTASSSGVVPSSTVPSSATPVSSTSPAANLSISSNPNKREIPLGAIENLVKELASGPYMNASSPACQIQLEQTDACLKSVMLLSDNESFVLPSTFEGIDRHFCQNRNATLKCLGGYSKCLTRVPRIIYNFVYRNVKRIISDMCATDHSKMELLRHATCFDTKTIKVLRTVVDKGTITAVYVLKNVPTDQIIPWGCCGFNKMLEEGKRQIDELCWNRSGNTTGRWIMDHVVRHSASDLLDIGCRQYHSIKSCNMNLPQAMKIFNQLTSGKEVPQQQFSPVIPLVEIARKLSSEFPDVP